MVYRRTPGTTGGGGGGGTPDDGSVTDAKVAVGAAINLDKTADGTTNKAYTASEKTKLAGIATAATANDTDANLKARANHTGAQAISTVTGLQAALDAAQPLDSDLTAIAGLTATTDNIIMSAASAWASRTPAQVRTALALVPGTNVQAWDADLDAWAAKTAPSGTVLGTSDTQTLTNKRVTPRTGTTTSSATPTINTDNVDFYSLTAQTADITSFTTNLSGTPTDGQRLHIAITGTAARAITWGASFEASSVALPTTTFSTVRLDVGFVWNSVTSKWRCVAAC